MNHDTENELVKAAAGCTLVFFALSLLILLLAVAVFAAVQP